MGELYREKRTQGGAYSGLDGRFRALKSSVGEFHRSNKSAAPGIVHEDITGLSGRKEEEE